MEMKGLICYENNFRHQVWGLGGWDAHPIALTLTPPVKEASPKGTKFTHSGCRGLTWVTGLKGRGGAFFVLQGCLLTYSPSRSCCGLIQAIMWPHRLLWGPLNFPRLPPPGSPSSRPPATGPPTAHAHCSPRLRPTWPVLGGSPAHAFPGRSQVAPIRVVSHRCRGSREEDPAGSEREASKETWGLAGGRLGAQVINSHQVQVGRPSGPRAGRSTNGWQ